MKFYHISVDYLPILSLNTYRSLFVSNENGNKASFSEKKRNVVYSWREWRDKRSVDLMLLCDHSPIWIRVNDCKAFIANTKLCMKSPVSLNPIQSMHEFRISRNIKTKLPCHWLLEEFYRNKSNIIVSAQPVFFVIDCVLFAPVFIVSSTQRERKKSIQCRPFKCFMRIYTMHTQQ